MPTPEYLYTLSEIKKLLAKVWGVDISNVSTYRCGTLCIDREELSDNHYIFEVRVEKPINVIKKDITGCHEAEAEDAR